jgi:plastocyanin
MRRVVWVSAACAFVVLAGCGGGASEVLVRGFRFQPARLAVDVDSTVTWQQQDDTTHTVTAGTPASESGLFDHRGFGQGDTFSFTFDRTGAFSYFCSIHPEAMRGTVEVN